MDSEKKQTILLTGATGFLGSKLLYELIKNNYRVIVLKRSTSSLERIDTLSNQYKFYDIDKYEIGRIFEENEINVVIHLATVYGKKGDETLEVVEGNLIFSIKLLVGAMQNKCQYFINTSSFFCKQIEERFIKSKTMYMPDYTLTKHQFTQWGKMYSDMGKINFINLQLEHIYGDNDEKGKFIPWVEDNLRENVPYINLTDGIQLRDFTPAEEVVKIYLKILNELSKLKGYNSFEVGTGEAISVRTFVENLKDKYDSKTELRFGKIQRSDTEIMYSSADKMSPYIISRKEKNDEKNNCCNSNV